MGIEARLRALEDVANRNAEGYSGIRVMTISHTKEDGSVEEEVWETSLTGTGLPNFVKIEDNT